MSTDGEKSSGDSKVILSVVGPAFNEAHSLEEFVDRCLTGFAAVGVDGEILIVDDGSTDETNEIMRKLLGLHPNVVRCFMHRRNLGLTKAMKTGFENAGGEIILMLPTDLECHPDEDIPIFIEGFREGADVVACFRKSRGDGKIVLSKIYNVVSNWLFGMSLKDMNWIKGFRRECTATLEMRGDWHRFILMMLHTAGYRIIEKEVQWYPRRYGKSKFGKMRIPLSLVDAVSIWFMLTFSRKPMRLFGSMGIFSGILGVLIHLGLVIYYVAASTQIRPLFWTALVLELFAVQLVFFGFLTELIERVRDDMDAVQIKNKEKPPMWIELGQSDSSKNPPDTPQRTRELA